MKAVLAHLAGRVIEPDRTYLRRVVASYRQLFPRSQLRIDVLGAGAGAGAGSAVAGVLVLLL